VRGKTSFIGWLSVIAMLCYSAAAQEQIGVVIHGIDADGSSRSCTSVSITSASRTTLLPLLPYVFYDRGSAELPKRYAQYSVMEASSFLAAPMEVSSGRTQQSVIGAYYDVINIIGRRLSLNPKARITLHGSAVSDEDVSLATERVKRVREYLESRYPLTRGRIAVAHGATNQRRDEDPRLTDEARHVYISGDWEVLRPIVVTDTVLKVSPPTLSFTLEHVRQSLQDVRIIANRGGIFGPLFAYNDIELPREPITWNLNQVARDVLYKGVDLADELEIRAEVMYEDSPLIDSATLRLPLVRNAVNSQVLQAQNYRREFVYNLILFNRDMSDLSPEHIRVIDSLIAADGSISSRSTIRVVGYADSTGSQARNESLSRERAEKVAARLRKRFSGTMPSAGISEVRGVGTYDVLRLPDGQLTPESRFYSRTVFIYVEESQ
jgi:hypothetical protein